MYIYFEIQDSQSDRQLLCQFFPFASAKSAKCIIRLNTRQVSRGTDLASKEKHKNKTTEYIFPTDDALLPHQAPSLHIRASYHIRVSYPQTATRMKHYKASFISLIPLSPPQFTTFENKHSRSDLASSKVRQMSLRYTYANTKLCQLVKQIDAGWQKSCEDPAELSTVMPCSKAAQVRPDANSSSFWWCQVNTGR